VDLVYPPVKVNDKVIEQNLMVNISTKEERLKETLVYLFLNLIIS
jgi:hypothetical protein